MGDLMTISEKIDVELASLAEASEGYWWSDSAKQALREAFEGTPEEYWGSLRKAIDAAREEEHAEAERRRPW